MPPKHLLLLSVCLWTAVFIGCDNGSQTPKLPPKLYNVRVYSGDKLIQTYENVPDVEVYNGRTSFWLDGKRVQINGTTVVEQR